MWAIIVIVIVVLLAIWWFVCRARKPRRLRVPERQKQGMLAPSMDYALLPSTDYALPGNVQELRG